MKRLHVLALLSAAGILSTACVLSFAARGPGEAGGAEEDSVPGLVKCANLIYGFSKSSVCYSDEFLAQIQKEANVRTNRRFFPVKLESQELYEYPFAVMTGEGSFSLTAPQRANLRNYLGRGGFLVASPGCSSAEWDASFRAEVRAIFPEIELKTLPMSHPIFNTVYEIKQLKTSHGGGGQSYLQGLEIDGKIVLVYSHDGLNDTANAGPGCCCCGGNEIINAQQVNVNLLAYALTH